MNDILKRGVVELLQRGGFYVVVLVLLGMMAWDTHHARQHAAQEQQLRFESFEAVIRDLIANCGTKE